MFYESERIIHKNQKHEKTRAYAVISDLASKGLSKDEQIEAIKILLNNKNTEFQTSVLERAKMVLEAQMEIKDENGTFNSDGDDSTGNAISKSMQWL